MTLPLARSLWLDSDRPTYGPIQAGRHYDTVVVGGGLTGLATALLLARGGQAVAVVEARKLGSATTGNTTAKVSLLQGTRLSELSRRNPSEIVAAYVAAGHEGQAWMLRYCEEHGVGVQTRAAFTYATTDEGRRSCLSELEAAKAHGLPVGWDDTVDLPYPTKGAVRLDDQAQLDPMHLLDAIAADLDSHGGQIFEDSRVLNVGSGSHGTEALRIATEHGELTADRVVLATGVPILDRGGFFARLSPMRSYAAAFAVPVNAPKGMYLSADEPTRSVRSVPTDQGELLLTGGNGHVVGRERSARALVNDLTDWTRDHFPGAVRTHWWSAQDYESVDGPPYIGALTPFSDRILTATGYDKWGMTTAVAAALSLTSRILGGHIAWAEALDSWRLREIGAVPRAAAVNASVAAHLAKGWLKAVTTTAPGNGVPDDTGRVQREGAQPMAVCKMADGIHRVHAACTHLCGIVEWNDAERTWDCPLHGSRFAPDGSVLNGPATKPLRPMT
jgi:glycine/D-amino acid oxidase-like deaminating enzyme